MSSINFRIYDTETRSNYQENTNSGNTNSGFRIYDTYEYSDEFIVLSDIATYNGIIGDYQIWLLNGNTTILSYQTLIIPTEQELQTNSFTLTNDGTINILGSIRNGETTDYNCVTINNGIINIFSGGALSAIGNDTNVFTNNYVVNNNTGGVIVSIDYANITNNSVINNYGTIITNSSDTINYGIIYNTGGVLSNYNYSPFSWLNYGTIYNTGGGIISNTYSLSIFTNNGTIYNNDGSLIDNTNGSFVNDNGIIHNPLTDHGCGIGTIAVPITTGIVDESC